MDSPEDSNLTCSCGLSAKLRTSKTHRNPYRMFYNCPKYPNNQCEFFQWCDEPLLTGDKHLDELNLIRSECVRLQERIDDIQQEWDNERADWNRERTELTSELSTVKAELDKIKNEIKLVNESIVLHWTNYPKKTRRKTMHWSYKHYRRHEKKIMRQMTQLLQVCILLLLVISVALKRDTSYHSL